LGLANRPWFKVTIVTICDRNFKHCPSYDKWKRAERMCEFLRLFYITTYLILDTSYPTSNEFFMQV